MRGQTLGRSAASTPMPIQLEHVGTRPPCAELGPEPTATSGCGAWARCRRTQPNGLVLGLLARTVSKGRQRGRWGRVGARLEPDLRRGAPDAEPEDRRVRNGRGGDRRDRGGRDRGGPEWTDVRGPGRRSHADRGSRHLRPGRRSDPLRERGTDDAGGRPISATTSRASGPWIRTDPPTRGKGRRVADDVASTLVRLDLDKDVLPRGWSEHAPKLLGWSSGGTELLFTPWRFEEYLYILHADGSITRVNADPGAEPERRHLARRIARRVASARVEYRGCRRRLADNSRIPKVGNP